jgi:peptidoglycan/LPS O-acetylase OafA/YrhL
MMLHCAGDSLMIGCLAALLEGNPLLRQAVRHRWAPTAAYAAMFFVGFVSPTLDHRFRGAYDITIGMTINGLLIAGVLIYITRNPQTRLVRFLELPWMRTIGAMSYSLYLWQQLFLGEADWRWSSFPLSIVAAALTATASNLIVERPFLRMRKRFAPNARAPKSEHLPAAAQA